MRACYESVTNLIDHKINTNYVNKIDNNQFDDYYICTKLYLSIKFVKNDMRN